MDSVRVSEQVVHVPEDLLVGAHQEHSDVVGLAGEGVELEHVLHVVGIDELVDRSSFTAAEVASMLLILELEGIIVCQDGRYTCVS